jgi:hypothetical protein
MTIDSMPIIMLQAQTNILIFNIHDLITDHCAATKFNHFYQTVTLRVLQMSVLQYSVKCLRFPLLVFNYYGHDIKFITMATDSEIDL